MRTVREFTKIVREENREHSERLLNMSPVTLIERAWEIAKWQAIYEYMEGKVIPYLEDGDDEFEEFLMLEIDKPISAVYDFELNYNEPQWVNWDDLDDVVRDMFEEIKNQNN